MPSQRNCGQVGFKRTISTNSLPDVPSKVLDVSSISQRIVKRKKTSRRSQILKSLSLRRQKKNGKSSNDRTVSSDDESNVSTNLGQSSDTNQEEVRSSKSVQQLNAIGDSHLSQPHPDHRFYTDHVLMVEPTAFYLNEETIEDNKFMQRVSESKEQSSRIALEQYNAMVENLRRNNIRVTAYKQQADNLPDSVFPDWFTTVRQPDNAKGGVLFTYPMKTKSRQGEYNP